MRDWDQFVRREFRGTAPPSDEAVEELAQHLEETYRAAVACGRSATEAMTLARAELRNGPRRPPPGMASRGGVRRWIAGAGRDGRYAARMLRARPAFTAAAVLTLALGIGANTAIFSVVRSLLLQPLPFPRADRLMLLWEADARDESRLRLLSAPNFFDLTRRTAAVETAGLWEYLNFNLTGDGDAERVPGLRMSASTFRTLGVVPEIGRTFTPAEDAPGHDVVVLSHALWQRRYGGRSDIVGAIARINDRPFEIVGVMPASFVFPFPNVGLWVPIALNHDDQSRGSHSFEAVIRLRDGVRRAAADAELDTVARNLAGQFPDDNHGETATLMPMRDFGIERIRPTLLALSGAVVLVLAIACVNIANLLLVQASSRRQEFAIRGALGADRARIARQLVIESLAVAAAGGMAGFAVAWVGSRLLVGILPANFVSAAFRPNIIGIRLDPIVLAFTAAVSLLTGLAFGLAPLAALRADLAHELRIGESRGATGRMPRMRSVLVATEIALSLVVLVAAGLMVKSLVRLVSVNTGLDPTDVLVVSMSLPQPDFYGPPVRQAFCRDVTQRVGALPGIISVGATSHLPLSGANAGRSFSIEGHPVDASQTPNASYHLTCPGYFRSLGIPIIRGRDFDSRDTTNGPQVAILNESAAKRYWPNEDPIGRRIKLGLSGSDAAWMTIVGVVGDVRHNGLDQAGTRELFRPYSQAAWPVMTIVAKTAGDPLQYASAIRSALQKLDPDDPRYRTTTMEGIEAGSMGDRRFPMTLLVAFGAIALALAIVGVYGVVSYVVTQRTREIGIRMALGAGRRDVIRLVLAGALRPLAVGLTVGTGGAVLAGRLLGTLLFDVKPDDPTVLIGIVGLLATTAVAASLVPGTRATRVDPVAVLKAE